MCQHVFYKIRIYYTKQTAEPQREGERRWAEEARTYLEPGPTPSLRKAFSLFFPLFFLEKTLETSPLVLRVLGVGKQRYLAFQGYISLNSWVDRMVLGLTPKVTQCGTTSEGLALA